MFYSLQLQLIPEAKDLNSLQYSARSWFLVPFSLNVFGQHEKLLMTTVSIVILCVLLNLSLKL